MADNVEHVDNMTNISDKTDIFIDNVGNIQNTVTTSINQIYQSITKTNLLLTQVNNSTKNIFGKIDKAAKDQSTNSQSINQQAKQSSSQSDLLSLYKARQVAGGIDSIMSGNFISGLRQLGSTIPSVAKFMGGPYYLALELAVKGFMKFDEAISKSAKNMIFVTGGLTSEFVGNKFKAFKPYHDLKESLREIGLQGNIEEIIKSISSSYGMGFTKNNLQNLVKVSGYAQQGLGAFGISQQSSQGLISNLQLIEGKTNQGVYAQLYRLTNRFNKMQMFSSEQALQQITSLYDQTKNLGTNFEWASRMVTKFERGLKDGTVALSDFAAVNRSLRGGNISSNAGIASLISDYANRTGIQLPSGFSNSNILGQSYAISTKAMLSNNQFAKAYQGQIQEMLDQIGGTTKEERAGALQLILQSRGINVSSEMAGNAIKTNGQIDLIGQGIIGSKMGQKEDEEKREAEKYQQQVRDYYAGTATYQELMKRWIGGIFNKYIGNSMATGVSEGMSLDYKDFWRNIAAIYAHPVDNTVRFWKDTFNPLSEGITINIKSPNQ